MPYGFPDICGFYDMLYGTAGVDLGGLTCLYFGGASGMVFSGNPPYTVTDFLGIYPKFFGPETVFTGLTITAASAVVSGFSAGQISTLRVGTQLVVAANIFPKDTLIASIDTGANTVTMTNPALAVGTQLSIYLTPFMPLVAIMSYLQLALACVMYSRYKQAWLMQIAYFVAHYCTLYMRSESGVPNITAAQVASSGLTKGIIVHRAAGDVSADSKLISGYEEFGAWAETQYGELFITVGRATCMGPIWVP